MVVILTAMLPSPAGTQQVQELCWSLNPFVDTLLVDFIQGEGEVSHLNGQWRANATAGQQAAGGAGPATYQLLGSGTATASVTLPNSFEAGFQAAHNTTFFGGNFSCNFFAVIDNVFTLSGSWTLQCPGTTPFEAEGTLTSQSPCPAQD